MRVIDLKPTAGIVPNHFLNPPQHDFQPHDNTSFLMKALGDPKEAHYRSRESIAYVRSAEGLPVMTSKLFQAAHNAFGQHVPLTISPESIWYMVVHELAICVKQNTEAFRHRFTKSEDQVMIRVEDDSLVYGSHENNWARTIGLFEPELKALVPGETTALFVPTFSTTTAEDRVAFLLAFMDVVSDYYEYRVRTKCAIPKVRLMGTPADWNDLHDRVMNFSDIFAAQLNDWFPEIMPSIEKLVAAAEGEDDEEFWASLYKYRNMSGGPTVNGWLQSFMAYEPTDDGFEKRRGFGSTHTDSFPQHISQVSFLWEYLGKNIPMHFSAGMMGVDVEDGFLTPKLGFAITEDAEDSASYKAWMEKLTA